MSTCKQRQSEALFGENREPLCFTDTTHSLQFQNLGGWGGGLLQTLWENWLYTHRLTKSISAFNVTYLPIEDTVTVSELCDLY